MRNPILLAAILSIAILPGCASNQSATPDVPIFPEPAAVATPTLTDAHGCSERDWLNASAYRGDLEHAKEEEARAESMERAEAIERDNERRELDDRQDLDAKIYRHDLNRGGGERNIYESIAENFRAGAADEFNQISRACRAWLTSGRR